jgi:hypothetical protein
MTFLLVKNIFMMNSNTVVLHKFLRFIKMFSNYLFVCTMVSCMKNDYISNGLVTYESYTTSFIVQHTILGIWK